ncbi:hypothetical protein Q5752_004288 [Cryptotrichosporon argae]
MPYISPAGPSSLSHILTRPDSIPAPASASHAPDPEPRTTHAAPASLGLSAPSTHAHTTSASHPTTAPAASTSTSASASLSTSASHPHPHPAPLTDHDDHPTPTPRSMDPLASSLGSLALSPPSRPAALDLDPTAPHPASAASPANPTPASPPDADVEAAPPSPENESDSLPALSSSSAGESSSSSLSTLGEDELPVEPGRALGARGGWQSGEYDPIAQYRAGLYDYTKSLYTAAQLAEREEQRKRRIKDDLGGYAFGRKTSGMEKLAQKKALARRLRD